MVVDTSALVAILLREPDAERFAHALGEASVRLLSAVTRVELSFVIEGRKREAGRADLELLLRDGGFEIVAVTPQQADIAIGAFRRFGRGRHRAGLNIGDCFAYALAAASERPLLFKGDDFIHTDIRPALPAIGGVVTIRKKLIEVSIPLEAINKASAREKSIRHGHPSTLHLWWARRPLAACRAVLFAQLVDDPSAWPDRYPIPRDRERRRGRAQAAAQGDRGRWCRGRPRTTRRS